VPYSDPNSGIGIAAESDEVTGPGRSGGGVWKQEDAAHIIANDPRQIIADCEAGLAIVAQCEKYLGGEGEQLMWHASSLANRVLTEVAKSYGWAPEGTTP
jgi:hypothetical protein